MASLRDLGLALLLCSARAAAADATPPAKLSADKLVIDVLRLGAPIAAFEEKYGATLCDRDPIDKRTRTIWFHAPRPCRQAEPLPHKTILVAYTRSKSPEDAVEALAWFGDWPKLGGNFPLAVGVTPAQAAAALGAPARMFDFGGVIDGGERLTVWRHPGAIYSIVRDGAVFGYVAGAMGDDREREEWRGLVANVLRTLRRAQ